MHGPQRGSPAAVAATVALVGAAITIALTWATVAAYDQNEDSLVDERVDQGAAVLMAAVPTIDLPLVLRRSPCRWPLRPRPCASRGRSTSRPAPR